MHADTQCMEMMFFSLNQFIVGQKLERKQETITCVIWKKNLMQNKQSKNVIYLLCHRVKDAFNGFGVKHRHDLALNEALHWAICDSKSFGDWSGTLLLFYLSYHYYTHVLSVYSLVI